MKKFRKDAWFSGEITFSNTRWHKSPFAPLWELAALLSNRYTLHFALSLEGDACEQAKLCFEVIFGKIIFQYRISGMVEVKRGAGEAFVSRGKSKFGIWLQQNILLATVELLYFYLNICIQKFIFGLGTKWENWNGIVLYWQTLLQGKNQSTKVFAQERIYDQFLFLSLKIKGWDSNDSRILKYICHSFPLFVIFLHYKMII